MRRMVVESKMVIQDGEIRMIQSQEMLQTSPVLVRRSFDIIHMDWWDINGTVGTTTPAEAEFGHR